MLSISKAGHSLIESPPKRAIGKHGVWWWKRKLPQFLEGITLKILKWPRLLGAVRN